MLCTHDGFCSGLVAPLSIDNKYYNAFYSAALLISFNAVFQWSKHFVVVFVLSLRYMLIAFYIAVNLNPEANKQISTTK